MLSQSPPSLSLSPSLPLLLLSPVSEALFSLFALLPSVLFPPCARSSVLLDVYAFLLLDGEKGAPNICLRRTFLRLVNFNPLGFLFMNPKGMPFLLVTQEEGRGRREKVGGCVIAPSLSHWSASFLRVNERPEAKSLKRNGS